MALCALLGAAEASAPWDFDWHTRCLGAAAAGTDSGDGCSDSGAVGGSGSQGNGNSGGVDGGGDSGDSGGLLLLPAAACCCVDCLSAALKFVLHQVCVASVQTGTAADLALVATTLVRELGLGSRCGSSSSSGSSNSGNGGGSGSSSGGSSGSGSSNNYGGAVMDNELSVATITLKFALHQV